MRQHRHTVLGQLHVGFDHADAETNAALERGEPMAILAPEATDRSIKLALNGLIGSILHYVATRRERLTPSEVQRLVDAAIGLARS